MATAIVREQSPWGRVSGEPCSSGAYPASMVRRSWIIKRQTVRGGVGIAQRPNRAPELHTVGAALLPTADRLGHVGVSTPVPTGETGAVSGRAARPAAGRYRPSGGCPRKSAGRITVQ
jgi:hypothetical protein